MRVSNLNAPNRCTSAGEFKDNTFSITLELTASELGLLTSALDWQQQGMQVYLDKEMLESGSATLDWIRTIERSKVMQNILETIGNVIF